MSQNLGKTDRLLRTAAAILLFTCSVMAPLPLTGRLLGCALPGAYLLFTALVGTCLGYRLMGRSTCGAPDQRVSR